MIRCSRSVSQSSLAGRFVLSSSSITTAGRQSIFFAKISYIDRTLEETTHTCHAGRGRLSAVIIVATLSLPFGRKRCIGQDAKPSDRVQSPPRLLAHYMPWYEAKPHSPHWGWHWTMGAFDPDAKTAGQAGDRFALSAAHRSLRLGRSGRDRVSRALDETRRHRWRHLRLVRNQRLFDYASIHRHASAFVEPGQSRPASSSPSATKIRRSPSSSRRGRLEAERTRRARPARDRLAAQELVSRARVPEARQSAGPTFVWTRRLD